MYLVILFTREIWLHTLTASIKTVKLLLNATVPERANLLRTDITDFYIGTPISTPEYMWIPYKFFSPALIALYHLKRLQHK